MRASRSRSRRCRREGNGAGGRVAVEDICDDGLANRLRARVRPPVACAMVKLQSHSTSNPTSIAQKAAVEALRGPAGIGAEHAGRVPRAPRFRGSAAARRFQGSPVPSRKGAFYAYPECGRARSENGISNSLQFAERLLEERTRRRCARRSIRTPTSTFASRTRLRCTNSSAGWTASTSSFSAQRMSTATHTPVRVALFREKIVGQHAAGSVVSRLARKRSARCGSNSRTNHFPILIKFIFTASGSRCRCTRTTNTRAQTREFARQDGDVVHPACGSRRPGCRRSARGRFARATVAGLDER